VYGLRLTESASLLIVCDKIHMSVDVSQLPVVPCLCTKWWSSTF